MDRHSKNYELLGIRPKDSWQKLRDSYKSAVRKWHPDRFTQSNSERGIAEEKTKEINRAFRELQEHYLQYGSLPMDEPQPAPPRPDQVVTPASPPRQTTAAASATDQHTWKPASNDARKKGAGNRLRFGLALIGLLLAGYFFLVPEENELPVDNHFADSSIIAVPSARIDQAPQKVASRNFTTGSSLGEVHSIQGIPTRIDGEIWHYGDAKVFFKNGKVSHWVDSADRRLLAQSSHESPIHEAAVQYFDKGSTKAEVRAIQGSPLRETDKVWDYGISRIYFDRDKVVGWHESPLEPLRTRR